MDLVSAFFGCLIWLPLMFWVLSLVQWMIMGEIDAGIGLLGIFVGIGLGIVAVVPPIPILSAISFVVVVGTMVLYPFVRLALNKHELRSVDVDALRRMYESVGQRPLNPSARFRLAQHVWNLGMPGHALAIAEESINQMPIQLFRDEHRLVAAWKKRPLDRSFLHPINCPDCGCANPPGKVFCEGCGAPFLLRVVQGRFAPGETGKRLISAWVAMVAVLVGIPATTALPPLLTIVSIVVLFTVIGVVLWLAFRPVLKGAV